MVMPAYRCVFRTHVFPSGGPQTHQLDIIAPDDATAVAVAESKAQKPHQTVEVWHGSRRVSPT